ncbi:unnamed protein product [Rotaria magnacalcarata]|uniref:Uncharacterized protein n=1 Tax=Rotaria magnacalcarata TaxID=392030 RepID=A0A816CXV9_9BILA|nr:unnamed protein product [Rotaria magnacalcarata]CAF1631034.1 unnamed protein product [Rotaria magnacalcarata]CAF2028917.1 unnamed protein product [Rotaria magnacalcarata]CAF2062730.1 unnamed protein product [Rotaria magnacalcarata]CAF2110113.1 unnamed protein product [Rotaria magnacalcarata]
MLFHLAHANENEDGVGYKIKHVFVKSSSLLHAHIFVELFGFRISPEYYDDYDELYEPSEQTVQTALRTYSLEALELTNESCSLGEHYWHAIKPLDYDGLPFDLQGNRIFKVSIGFKIPCAYEYEQDFQKWSPYKTEMNTNIYQFKAISSTDVLTYIRQNSDKFNVTNFFRELPSEFDWQIIEQISEESIHCKSSNHIHGDFICMKCVELQSLIPIIDSNM